MLKAHKTQIYTTLLLATLFAVAGSQRNAGGIVALAVLALLGWVPWSAYVILRKPGLRASQLARLSIWLVAVAVAAGMNHMHQETMRKDADDIVAAIDRYVAVHRDCPETLDEIGISRDELTDMLGYSGYACVKGRPMLFYASPGFGFAKYRYDFATHAWIYIAD